MERTESGTIDARAEKVIVTGSSGFLGTAIVERLARTYRVIGFDQPGAPHPPPAAECLDVDLTNDDSVTGALAEVRGRFGERIASVIHLAAYYNFSGEPSPLYEQVTVRGTERLLSGLRDFQVEQFVFSSTMLVHAPCEPGQRIDEEWPLEPKWDYPKSKVDTERLISAQRGQMPAVLLRIAGVYDDTGHSIPLAHQVQRIYERRLTGRVYPGDTSRGQAFVHRDDVVEAIALAVEKRATLPPETALVIGEPDTLSYDMLQRDFSRLIHGEVWETREIPKPLAKAGAWVQDEAHERLEIGDEPFIKPWMVDLADDHYALDISRARTLLGWQPRHRLRDTLPKMVAALKADPAGWYRENKLSTEAAPERPPAPPAARADAA